FFHWQREFPDVFAEDGGFDVVLGNPPWERLKLQEREWFAARCPAITTAPDAATRRRLLKSLKTERPALHAAFEEARRRAEAEARSPPRGVHRRRPVDRASPACRTGPDLSPVGGPRRTAQSQHQALSALQQRA